MEKLNRKELDVVGLELVERLNWAEDEEFIFKTMFTLITLHSKFNDVIF